MIYRKLSSEDLNLHLTDLLNHNDCGELYLMYTSYMPNDIFGAFDGTKLVAIIAACDSVEYFYYSIANASIECETRSLLFGAYVETPYRRQKIFNRLFTLGVLYIERHYVERNIITWTSAVYKLGKPATEKMNIDCWINKPEYRYKENALFRPLKYTDVSIRADNKQLCKLVNDRDFRFIGLNAFDNSPVFLKDKANLNL